MFVVVYDCEWIEWGVVVGFDECEDWFFFVEVILLGVYVWEGFEEGLSDCLEFEFGDLVEWNLLYVDVVWVEVVFCCFVVVEVVEVVDVCLLR